jgi:hypothetical protein
MEERETISLLEANLARQLHWIAAADTKAGFAFTLVTAMLGLLAALAPATTAGWDIASAVFSSLTAVTGSGSLVCLWAVAFPRTDGPRPSLVYCGGVSVRTAEQFREEFMAISPAKYAADLAVQCHRNAEIASTKFTWVQRAMMFLCASVPLWVASIWLLYGRAPVV